jgi:hypothetical protein
VVLSLQYGDLSGAVAETNRLANELGQYCDELSRKVQQKMHAVEGGMSSALSSADYYVNAKTRQLRERERGARTLSTKTQTLLDTAKRVDADVERVIQANQKSFFQRNPDLKPSDFKLWLTSFGCDLKNVPILGDIIRGGEQIADAYTQLCKDIRYWYKCGGGEQLLTNLVDIFVKIGEAVAAVGLVVLLVVSGAGILAVIGGAILAVIAAVNAAVNFVTSIQAIQAGKDDPVMSKIYAERDTLKQVLREENFHNKFLNRLSNAGASLITGLEVVGTVFSLAGGIKDIFKNWTHIKQSFHWTLQNKNFAAWKLSLKDGPLTLWNGLKTVGVKLGQNIPQIARGGFKISAVVGVLKKWQWAWHSAELFKNLNGAKELIPDVINDFTFYQKNNSFYTTSDQLEKLRTIVVIPPTMNLILPKFEYPYLNVAGAA